MPSDSCPLNPKDVVREATSRPSMRTSTFRISSAMPSEKYSWSPSADRSANGSTAIEFSAAPSSIASSSTTATASAASSGTSRSTAMLATARTKRTIMTVLMRLPVCGVIDASRSISFSSFTPSGVSSKIQEKTTTNGNPSISIAMRNRNHSCGTFIASNNNSAACKINQEATTYTAATFVTFLRLSSCRNDIVLALRIEGYHVSTPSRCRIMSSTRWQATRTPSVSRSSGRVLPQSATASAQRG